jgi:hypothetical protein
MRTGSGLRVRWAARSGLHLHSEQEEYGRLAAWRFVWRCEPDFGELCHPQEQVCDEEAKANGEVRFARHAAVGSDGLDGHGGEDEH